MTALLIAYFLGYGTHIKKALRGYVTIAVLLIVFVQVSGTEVTYAQEHDASISSITEDDLEETESSTGSTSTGETTSGSSANEETVLAEVALATTTYNDSEGTAVDELNKLLDLKDTYKNLDVFKGNNTEFYELLRDRLAGYSTAKQAEKFVSIVDKLDILDDETYSVYGLHKDGIMDVLPEMAENQRELITSSDGTTVVHKEKMKWESSNTDMLELEYELFYGATKATAGLPIVFHLGADGPTNIKRATRRFGNGRKHTCTRSQCDRIGVVYDEADTYKIIVSFRYANGETGKHIFDLKVGEEIAKKTHSSADERVIIDVMNDKESTSTEKIISTIASNETDEKSDPLNEALEQITTTTAEDDEEIDDAFESLLVSIFGE